ncbi:MAG: hypothetical protein R2731_12650 [Nocardioides sp.]
MITDEAGGYTVACKKAGKQLVMIPFKASMTELKYRTLATYAFAGLSFVGGLLMVIFRRKKPKYSGLQLARAMAATAPPGPGPRGPGQPGQPGYSTLPPPSPGEYAGSERGPGSY